MHRWFSYNNRTGRNYLDLIRFMLLTLILVLGADCYSYAEKYSQNRDKLTFAIRHQPTEKVILKLSQLSGYKIEIDQEYNSIPISLEMQSVDLNRALIEVLRALRITNHAILMDEANKTAAIIIFSSIDDAYTTMSSATGANDGSDKARYGMGAAHLEKIKQDYFKI